MQTSRQIIDNLLRNRRADRVGLYDEIWSDTLNAWIEQGYPVDEQGRPVPFAEHFGFDMVGVGGWFQQQPHREVRELVEESDEWQVHRDGWGALLKYWKNRSGTPEHIDFHMTTREIWERDYRPHLLHLDPDRVKVDENRRQLARHKARNVWTFYGHQFIFETMRQSMGDIGLYEATLLDPAWIHDFNTVLTSFHQAHYRLLFEQAGLPDGIWMYEDLGYKHRLFCSPDTCRHLLFPYYRQMVDFFHSFDLPVVLHTCGYTEPLLDVIIETGFDALNPMEVKAGNDPLRIAERCGDKLALIGGLDARILESRDPDLIRSRVGALVDGMKARGARYVFGSDHSLSTNIRYRDFQAALEAYREHMAY